jgi:hypothetical protein
MIEVVFGTFGIVALVVFCFVRPAYAVAITCFAGWLLLPVGNFPVGSAEALFPYWITGAAVPSDMLLTKMWWPPAVALSGALLFDQNAVRTFRPSWLDLPIALWCSWPIAQSSVAESSDPQSWIASLYLLLVWGVPWLLGRIYFGGLEGGQRLLTTLVSCLFVIVPIALIEGVVGPRVYGWIYEPHPFRFDGANRYFGFRPIAFFEHGNQYGLWVAAIALAAIWLWRTSTVPRLGLMTMTAAGAATAVLLSSQSVGAICLFIGGLGLCFMVGFRVMRWMAISVLILALIGGVIYVSGTVPLREMAIKTVTGNRIVDLIRKSGRESFTWRIARDQSALNLIRNRPIVGTPRWDWWRDVGQRPWGLFLLIAGQFGFLGALLAFGSLITPVIVRICSISDSRWHYSDLPVTVIILMSIGDALLNSFAFYPAILAAGALATNAAATPACVTNWRDRPTDQ